MIRFRHAAVGAVAFSCAFVAAMTSTPGWALENAVPPVMPTVASIATASLNEATPVPVPAIRFDAPRAVVQPVPAEPVIQAEAPIDGTAFTSLTDAVSAQAMPADMADDLECLATAIFFESKGEPLSGQLAVANVILNRSRSGRFPETVCAVVKQPGQFGFVRGGAFPDVDEGRRDWRTAVAVAKVAMSGSWDAPAPGAMYFHARHVAPSWKRPRVASIGNHIFYR